MENENIKKAEKWDDMNLKEDLLRGIYAYGFEIPSDIQKKAIYPIIQGNDVIGQAQSGSGKTGTFSISTLQLIDPTINETQALILSPTHELVKQTNGVISSIGQYINNLRIKTLMGGTPVRDDIKQLKSSIPHIAIGSVGRILDMTQKNYLKLQNLKILIIDEADEMLTQGFSEKIRILFEGYFPEDIQVLLFSATMPPEILQLSKKFMRDPVNILMKKEELSLKCIQQYFVPVLDDQMKFQTLKTMFSLFKISKTIIYCNSVGRVNELYEILSNNDFSVCHIHSNMDKVERRNVFKQFCEGDIRILVSSDITARGIDIQQVSLVINYDLTRNFHTYLHRIGRGGRWGRKGTAINLITRRDIPDIKRIENYYNINIDPLPENFSESLHFGI
jgi:translation initiation factor 4A